MNSKLPQLLRQVTGAGALQFGADGVGGNGSYTRKGQDMSKSAARKQAIYTVLERQPRTTSIDYALTPVTDIFGLHVFSRSVMRTALPRNAYERFLKTLDEGEPLDPSLADIIANAMKDWALAKGATHYCHWFQPMTGQTAEKHDSFLVASGSEGAILEFSGKTLIQGEPDASSFPSGGIRSTFEARGYTGWDPTSPAFIMETAAGKTLCIPTVFCAYSGHALDKKTPLLRSLEAINKHALRLLNLLGNTEARRIICTVGPEQEYFLIDSAFYLLRPDIINAGRALFGARPPKGQEMEDHYWGSIKERVLAFIMDAEGELYRLGVPVKTRHNEVAPAQYEMAPVFEDANVATDHNMLTMEVFRNTAKRHGFRCLFHEKPFSGINGSGKHNNWSLMDDRGNNLLDPGHTPQENTQFLVLLTAVIRAINKYNKLLRASIATAGNDHRLGANEAPPAIMSIYLGDVLTGIINGIIEGKVEGKTAAGRIEIGVSTIPPLPKDATDRNRTSPFAFTGNKFEFRAVGASQSIALPNTVLCTIVAESFDHLAGAIEEAMRAGKNLNGAIEHVVKETLKENRRVIFNGDNYSQQWREEAAARGLPELRNTVESLAALVEPESRELFRCYAVLNEEELNSRYHIKLESYCKTINIEAQLTISIARTMLLPAALEYQTRLAQAISCTYAALKKRPDLGVQEEMLQSVCERNTQLKSAIDYLDAQRSQAEEHTNGNPVKAAQFYQQCVFPAMNAVREIADGLELIVDDDLWPLPKFQEILYIY